MGAGTPVVLRSDPRPRLAEEAILLMDGDKRILMRASGPDPEARDEREDEQSPGRPDEEHLDPGGLVSMGLDIRLFSLVLHTASPASRYSAAPDKPGG